MSRSPRSPSSSDDHLPDPRYKEWNEKSRKKLKERLCEKVDRQSIAVQELVTHETKQWISDKLNIDLKDDALIFRIDALLMQNVHYSISQQIDKWKGLRWWKFNQNVSSWNGWHKKAKCWQDQNQHKPLGRFWCFILEELEKYTLRVAQRVFVANAAKQQALYKCLHITCVLAVFTGSIRFERTRETPLLPVRTLTQSKEFQHKLQSVDSGFTLSRWKEQAQSEHKRQNEDTRGGETKQRGNIATLLNKKCCKHARNVYRQSYKVLKQMIPSLNAMNATLNDITDSDNDKEEEEDESVLMVPMMHDSHSLPPETGYHPTRGSNISPCESLRFSPMMPDVRDVPAFGHDFRAKSATHAGDGSSQNAHARNALLVENYYLRGELERMTTRYLNIMKNYNMSSRNIIASPMFVPVGNIRDNNVHYVPQMASHSLLNDLDSVNNNNRASPGIYSDYFSGDFPPNPYAYRG